MIQLCTNSPVPDLESIKADLKEQFDSLVQQFPNFNDLIDELTKINIPSLPQIRQIIYEGYSSILEEINEIVDALKQFQDSNTQFNMFQVMSDVIGGALEDLIPKIPVINISLIEIMNMDMDGMYGVVKEFIMSNLQLPFVPFPLFDNFSNYAKEVVLSVKIILTSYKDALLQALKSCIEQVLDILEISAVIPFLFAIPTISELKDLLFTLYPEAKSIYDIVSNFEIEDVLDNLKNLLPFPIPNFTYPFINFYSNLEEELINRLNQIVDYVSSLNLQTLVDFVQNTIGQLGWSFPTICVEL